MINTRTKPELALLIATILVCIWSAIKPYDYFVWFLEIVPAIIGFAIMFFTRKTFPLSGFLYSIILIHIMVLAVGGHYTYAEVPLFNYIKEVFDSSRNNYDKVGHFMQGITPTILMRELILRRTNLRNKIFICILTISSALAFSALYEIFEWGMSATASGEDFVGSQGDVWDAQKDILTAFIGAIFALVFFRKIHDRSLKKLQKNI